MVFREAANGAACDGGWGRLGGAAGVRVKETDRRWRAWWWTRASGSGRKLRWSERAAAAGRQGADETTAGDAVVRVEQGPKLGEELEVSRLLALAIHARQRTGTANRGA